MQRNVNLLEEPSEERVFEMQSSDMFTGTVTLPTTEFAPGEKFNIQVTALTEQVSGVRNISCTLKEYTQFHVPLSQNQTREFQGRYMKILNSTNSLWSGNEHTKVIPLTIPENTSFGCVNSMVDIYHELSVRVYFTSKNGEIEYVTINIPIHTISFDDSSESEQLPCYNATELPPSYAATTQCAEMGAVCVPERC
ncbi:hypothetical protein K7432_013084 [Basidiobolus ranarum]|uniref:Arrestin C-terminal-like domain-containing protein n=1 Tax=Basidiobolus ranarum TaxID=34480 RepID=A0ABR2VRH2_9FUNG